MASFDIRALKAITNSIFDHIIDDLKIDKLEIPEGKDFYWDVPNEHLYSIGNVQPTLSVGRLQDDWEFLKPLLENKNQAVALMLIHLSPLLRQIGTEVGQ